MTETEAIRENYNLGVLAGEAREQQRIINLLEQMSCGHYCRCMNGELCDSYEEAIALIKGEK